MSRTKTRLHADFILTTLTCMLLFMHATGQPNNASHLTPTAANWPLVSFYPPIQSAPLFVPVGPPNVLQVTVNAPFCNSYVLPPGSTPAYQIFCRTTFPTGLPNDLPLAITDIVASLPSLTTITASTANQGRRFTFSLFNCSTLDIDNWYRLAPSSINLGNTRCAGSLQCYYSPNGLPLTRYHSTTQSPPNIFWPYYCCTQTTTVAASGTSNGAQLRNETRCVYLGTDPANNVLPSVGDTCGSRAGMREICTLLLTSKNLFAADVTVHDWLCDYACSFPCISSAGGLAAALCSDPSGLRNCLPSAHDLQCTRDVTIAPPFCSQAGETAHGYVVTSGGLLAECATGQFGCTAMCRCFGSRGCPNHVNCTQQGTLYESEADGVPRQCMCNPLYYGDQCQFQLPAAVDCNRGQQLITNILNYAV